MASQYSKTVDDWNRIDEALPLRKSIIIYIFTFLPVQDLVSVSAVCRSWRVIADHDSLWYNLFNSFPWIFDYYTVPETHGQSRWKDLFIQRFQQEKQAAFFSPSEELFKPTFPSLQEYSRVESILQNGKVHLEDLLDAEDFISEVRRSKVVLIQFLRQPDVLSDLISYVFDQPSPEFADDMKRIQKFPDVAFQTLMCESIYQWIIVSNELLDQVFRFLEMKETMNYYGTETLRSIYFSRLVETIFEKYGNELLAYMMPRTDIIQSLVYHVKDQYLTDILFKFVDSAITHFWLSEAHLIPLLVDRLHDTDNQTQECATQTLISIMSLCPAFPHAIFATDLLEDSDTAKNLLDYIMQEPRSPHNIKNGLAISISVLSLVNEEFPNFVKEFLWNLGFFVNVLTDPPQTESISTSFGDVSPPLGSTRLRVLEFFNALLTTSYPLIASELNKVNAFNACLDLFFYYKWNNLMHQQVVQIIAAVLWANEEEVINSMLEKTSFIQRTMHAFDVEREGKISVGYMGHLIQLANELVKVTKYSPGLIRVLPDEYEWNRFVNMLSERNDMDTQALCGGVPMPDGLLFEDDGSYLGGRSDYDHEYDGLEDDQSNHFLDDGVYDENLDVHDDGGEDYVIEE